MVERIIGIIGGMGPEATGDLFQQIVRLTPASRDQDHIPVLVYSNPRIPERTAAILGKGEDPLPYLVETARILETAGAGILAMPCNTAHHFLPALRKQVHVPILDMISETLLVLEKRFPGAKSVGLLASLGTVHSRIYDKVFESGNVRVLAPDAKDQEIVDEGIRAVKAGRQDGSTRERFHSLGARLIEGGARAVILGCTEIPLSFDEDGVGYPSLNPTRILAQAAVDWALGRRD